MKWKRIPVILAVIAIILLSSAVILLTGSRENLKANRELADQYHRFVAHEIIATDVPEPDRMGLPDGSPITREVHLAQKDQVQDFVRSTVFHAETEHVLPAMQELRKCNRDVCGWLEIPGLVDLPVVYRDNTYYLNHDATGKSSRYGALFLDEDSPLGKDTQNLLIYGHNMQDGSMFGFLTHYRRPGYLRKHQKVYFTTPWEKEEYTLFAVLNIPMDPEDPAYFNFFSHPTFGSDTEFENYIQKLCSLSLVRASIDVQPSDALLTMSTCVGEERLVLVGRKK